MKSTGREVEVTNKTVPRASGAEDSTRFIHKGMYVIYVLAVVDSDGGRVSTQTRRTHTLTRSHFSQHTYNV